MQPLLHLLDNPKTLISRGNLSSHRVKVYFQLLIMYWEKTKCRQYFGIVISVGHHQVFCFVKVCPSLWQSRDGRLFRC